MPNKQFDSAWGVPSIDLEGLYLYDTPSAIWLDPTWTELECDAQASEQLDSDLLWPWHYKSANVSETMPSGKVWPKISIVTVTLNQGAYIEETLRSVLFQGYPNLEYIVIDGGSTDSTLSILKRYQSDLAYCVSESDKGQSNALNKGFEHATGDILAWLNSDDRYLPGILLKVAMMFDTYGADIVAGGCHLIRSNSLKPFKTHHNAMPVGKTVSLPLERLLDIDNCWQKGEFFYQPEVFWTREIWERSGAHLEETLYYSMDYELWLRMAYQRASIVHVPDAFALYRVHERQKTYGDKIPFLPELKEARDKFQCQVVSRKAME